MKMSILSSPLLKKFLSFSFGSWIALAIGFIATPITTRLFTPEEFGKASMFNLAINVLMIFVVLGADQSFVRFYYEENEEKRHLLLRNCIVVPLAVLGMLIPLFFVFENQISIFLFADKLPSLSIFLSFAVFLLLFQRFAVLVIRMDQRGQLFSYIQILMKLSTLVFTVLCFFITGNDFRALIWAQLGMLLLTSIVAFSFGENQWKFDLRRLDSRHSIKDIFKFSTPLIFTTLVMWLFQSFDRVAIKYFSNLQELGIYVAAFRIIVVLNVIQTTFTTFWTPVSYEHFEKDQNNTAFFENIHVIVSFVMLLIGVLSIMGKDLISLLVGEQYRAASQIMPFLIFMPMMYTISETTVIGIGFKKKTGWAFIISIIVCLANICGNYLLVPLLGGRGAAISTGLSYILFFILRTIVSYRLYPVNYDLKRLTISISLLCFYAIYSTLIDWSLINLLFGFLLIFIVVLLYIQPLIGIREKYGK